MLALAGSLTSGCTTASFAPPRVNMSRAVVAADGSTCVKEAEPAIDLQIHRNIDSASRLIDNFLLAYRCAQREAADGRQIFEIPSMIALAAAALGQTWGLSQDGAVGLAAYAALLGRGNSYYAPKEKAAMLNFAIDAVLCVKTESVGVSFYDTSQSPATQQLLDAQERLIGLHERAMQNRQRLADLDRQIEVADKAAPGNPARASLGSLRVQRETAAASVEMVDEAIDLQQELVENLRVLQSSGRALLLQRTLANGGTMTIDVRRKYFETVAGALFSIERVLADRLDDAGGQFDSAGITAEFEQLIAKQKELEKKKADTEARLRGRGSNDRLVGELREELIEIDLDQLQPKLQTCVLRAKMS